MKDEIAEAQRSGDVRWAVYCRLRQRLGEGIVWKGTYSLNVAVSRRIMARLWDRFR